MFLFPSGSQDASITGWMLVRIGGGLRMDVLEVGWCVMPNRQIEFFLAGCIHFGRESKYDGTGVDSAMRARGCLSLLPPWGSGTA